MTLLKRLTLTLFCLASGAAIYAAPDVAELQMPAVPDSLTAPGDRADYVARHFWDNLDFTDARCFEESNPMVEQAFVNFLSIFPLLEPSTRSDATRILLERASGNQKATTAFRLLASKYLDETESPFFNEEFYIPFLRIYAESPTLDEASRLRAQARLESALKNRPGMKAADFNFINLDGNRQSLHNLPAESNILLIFFDPNCEHCDEVMALIAENSKVADAVSAGKLSILAVYTGYDSYAWRRKAQTLPESWTVGMEPDSKIEDDELYDFPTMPSLYLLDSSKNVILKEITPLQLQSFFDSL